jgi:hypothetical protein
MMRIRFMNWLFLDRTLLGGPFFPEGWFLAYRPILIA